MGAVAVVVAGMVTVSVGLSEASAMKQSSAVRSRHALHGNRPAIEQRQAEFEVAKSRTLEVLYEDGEEAVTAIRSAREVPTQHGFRRVADAVAVDREWDRFLQSTSLEDQKYSHLVVIAHRVPDPAAAPQVHMVFPSERVINPRDGESSIVREYITDYDQTLSAQALQGWHHEGWSFYVKRGFRPVPQKSDTWWPVGNNGATRQRFEALLEHDNLRARVLRFLYLPENHMREFTAGQIVDGMGNPEYSGDREKTVKSVMTVLYRLVNADVTERRLEDLLIQGKGKIGYHRALTSDEIDRNDSEPIADRIDRFLEKHKGENSTILRHMDKNRHKRFNAEILAQEFPGKLPERPGDMTGNYTARKTAMGWILAELKDFGLIQLVKPGVKGQVSSLFQAF